MDASIRLVCRVVAQAQRTLPVALDFNMPAHILRVDHRDHGIKFCDPRRRVVQETFQDGARYGQTSRLNNDTVELAILGLRQKEIFDHRSQIRTDRATDTPIVHEMNILVRSIYALRGEKMVDSNRSKLVLDHGQFQAVVASEDVVQKRRLAGSEESSQNRDRNAVLWRWVTRDINERSWMT
jgi:hypothetical protein